MIIKEILNRRSVREYKKDEVTDEHLMELIKAAQFAPSGNGVHAVEFIIVKDQKTKEEICKIIFQDFVKDAPVLLVLICDTKKTNLVVQDLSVASENIFLQATALGLSTIWKNINSEWEDRVKAILGIPGSYKLINVIPVGYAKNSVEPHSDKEFSEGKIHKEHF